MIFFIQQALRQTLPYIAFFLSIVFLGSLFSLEAQAYLFFAYFMTLLSHDSLLSEKEWLESLYFNLSLKPYLQCYFFTKTVIIATLSTLIYHYYCLETRFFYLCFFFLLIFFNAYFSQLIAFFFEDFLPFFCLPFLSLSILFFNAFFLLSGICSVDILGEIKILAGLTLLFLPLIDYNFSYLLSLKFGPYE